MTYALDPDDRPRPLQRSAVLAALVFADADRRTTFLREIDRAAVRAAEPHAAPFDGRELFGAAAAAFAEFTFPHELGRHWSLRMWAERGAT